MILLVADGAQATTDIQNWFRGGNDNVITLTLYGCQPRISIVRYIYEKPLATVAHPPNLEHGEFIYISIGHGMAFLLVHESRGHASRIDEKNDPEDNIVKVGYVQLPDTQMLLDEYYAALEIQVRDTPHQTKDFLTQSEAVDAMTGVWLAYQDELAIGCVMLRNMSKDELSMAGLSQDTVAGEIKRLFVRPGYRGKRVADLLVNEVESFAIKHNINWLYLDSKDDLYAAIALYKRHGYTGCQRYNTNPQATVFLRKELLHE